jgi:hypothetical protein
MRITFLIALLVGIFSLLGCSKTELPPPSSPDFDKVLITLKINNNTALFILMSEDGTVNRMGSGSITDNDREMFIGINREPLFNRFIARVTPEMIKHQGVYDLPNRKGAECELTLLLGYRGSDRSAGFKFLYGSESQGPPTEISNLVQYATELTRPWHEEQKLTSKTKK